MNKPREIVLSDIEIRNNILAGDLEEVIRLHGELYTKEFQFSKSFEQYVAESLQEFRDQFDPVKDQVWICEHDNKMIGFLSLMHRPQNTAQLRYFIVLEEYRGIGLGKKLMDLYMDFLKNKKYSACYLLTVDVLPAAAALYKRHGFTLVEEKESSAFGPVLREQRYELHLPTS